MKNIIKAVSLPFFFMTVWTLLMLGASVVFRCGYNDVLNSGGNVALFIMSFILTIVAAANLFNIR
jgi:hypothetical protein